MQPPFNLLLLPIIAMREALKCMNPIELFELSQCSKKTADTLKIIGFKNFKLQIDFFSEKVDINGYCFQARKNLWKACVSGTRTFDAKNFEIQFQSEKNLVVFELNQFEGLINIFKHLSRIFNCPTYSLRSNWNFPREVFNSCVKFIVSRQKTIKILYIAGESLSEEDVKFALENLEVTAELIILPTLSQNFEVEMFDFQIIKHLEILHSSWLSLDILLTMKCAEAILLDNSSFTNKEINKFIKKWRSGELPNLQYLWIKSKNLNETLKIKGLEKLEENGENAVHLKKDLFSRSFFVRGSVPIQGHNGITGQFRFDAKLKEMILFI